MKKKKYYVYLEPNETSLVIQSLNRLKNSLLEQGRDSDCVDELMLKVMRAPTKKIKIA